jgi:hypothetical protein
VANARAIVVSFGPSSGPYPGCWRDERTVTDQESIWKELWDRLNAFFGILVDELRTRNQRLASLPGHQQTTAFPFTGYLSLCKTAPALDEDLVLTWSVARREDCLIVSADVARGDGKVLADAVPAELVEPVSRADLLAELERAPGFFRSNLDLIEQEVRS